MRAAARGQLTLCVRVQIDGDVQQFVILVNEDAKVEDVMQEVEARCRKTCPRPFLRVTRIFKNKNKRYYELDPTFLAADVLDRDEEIAVDVAFEPENKRKSDRREGDAKRKKTSATKHKRKEKSKKGSSSRENTTPRKNCHIGSNRDPLLEKELQKTQKQSNETEVDGVQEKVENNEVPQSEEKRSAEKQADVGAKNKENPQTERNHEVAITENKLREAKRNSVDKNQTGEQQDEGDVDNDQQQGDTEAARKQIEKHKKNKKASKIHGESEKTRNRAEKESKKKKKRDLEGEQVQRSQKKVSHSTEPHETQGPISDSAQPAIAEGVSKAKEAMAQDEATHKGKNVKDKQKEGEEESAKQEERKCQACAKDLSGAAANAKFCNEKACKKNRAKSDPNASPSVPHSRLAPPNKTVTAQPIPTLLNPKDSTPTGAVAPPIKNGKEENTAFQLRTDTELSGAQPETDAGSDTDEGDGSGESDDGKGESSDDSDGVPATPATSTSLPRFLQVVGAQTPGKSTKFLRLHEDGQIQADHPDVPKSVQKADSSDDSDSDENVQAKKIDISTPAKTAAKTPLPKIRQPAKTPKTTRASVQTTHTPAKKSATNEDLLLASLSQDQYRSNQKPKAQHAAIEPANPLSSPAAQLDLLSISLTPKSARKR